MIRFLIILLFFKGILFGCSLCSVYSPKTVVSIDIQSSDKYIKNAKVKWVFDQAFSDELLQLYDTNLDATFDANELVLIEESLLAYIEPKNHLVFLSYGKEKAKTTKEINVKNQKLTFKDYQLTYQFEFDLDYEFINGNKLFIDIHDDAGYFIMVYDINDQKFKTDYKVDKSVNEIGVTFSINDSSVKTIASEVKKEEPLKEEKTSLIEKSIEQDETVSEEVKKEKKSLDTYVMQIKKYLVEIEKGGDNLALFFLLLASFFYGVIHALGPGHGKALAFSYFSAQKSSYIQAFGISMATAFIHILGALVLVVVSVFILQSVLNSFIDDSITYITQTSAVLIMLLSIFILYRKLKKKSCACSSCCSAAIQEDRPAFSLSPEQKTNFVNTSTLQPAQSKNSRKKQDLFFILTAGIIPCPGTVVLFVYAFILKTYFSVILASIAISLGMGLVIFASSFLGVSLNKVSNRSHKLTNALEIMAPIFMFFLGLLLLLNADIF